MKKVLQNFIAFTLIISAISADAQMRYLDDIFTNVTVTSDVQFAENISILPAILSGGANPPALTPILCDIYQPTGDNLTNRPVVILAHTGSFLPQVINGQPTGDKKDSSIVQHCMRWARKGYVAVAMNNRLGWNPQSTDQDARTSTWLQAIYRGIQDAKAMVRFLRKTEDLDGNPYGIDPNKIALGGQGTGGYISLGYATLDTIGDNILWQEIYLPKFFNLTTMQPYVHPPYVGNYDGTDSTYLPIYDTSGNIIGQMPWNIPNWPSYSNDINFAFNIGGCLADSSWLEQGDVPMVSFHCTNDPYGPYANGDVIVPTTGNFVVEVQGSYIVQKHQAMYGNNAVFANAGFSDAFTIAANANNDGYDGLYPFITPTPQTGVNAFNEAWEEEGAPWDWWDNTTYELQANAIHDPNGVIPPGYFSANSLLGNPNMSSTKGNAYLDTIQGYLNPRMILALGLNIPGCTDSLACNYVPTATIDDSSCVYLTSTHTIQNCDSLAWNGQTYYTTGIYTWTGININGCDTTAILSLTINHATTSIDSQVHCDSYTWVDGITYTTSNNTATHMFYTVNGCDSLSTLDLTITHATTSIDTQVHCDSYTWVDGITYTTSNNTATHMFYTVNGCDSLSTLDLTITHATTSIDTQVHCDSYTWVDGITYTTSNNTATHMFYTVNGCDSLSTLGLTINTIPNTSIILGNTQTTALSIETYNVAQNIGSTFNWNLVNGGIIISGQTTNSIQVQWGNSSGIYDLYVIETNSNSCIGDTIYLTISLSSASSLENYILSIDKKLIKIVDILGRETKDTKNESLFYIYDDGTVEKKFILE